MGAYKNLIGMKFGKLTVLQDAGRDKGKNVLWLCQCDCGNQTICRGSDLTRGKIKSCGCLKKEMLSQKLSLNLLDQVFGRLTVIKKLESKNQKSVWLCKCECGNEIAVTAGNLTSGQTKSCGCLRKDISASKVIDESGNKYGRLTVIKREGSDKYGRAQWLCACDCGNTIICTGIDLRSGHIQSCGCLSSKGEAKIQSILEKMGVYFVSQYSFDDLISKNCSPYRFDFAVWYKDKIILIEYNGKQHYESGWGWNTEEALQKTRQRDAEKINYCKTHNIPLLIIPFSDFEKISEQYILQKLSDFF